MTGQERSHDASELSLSLGPDHISGLQTSGGVRESGLDMQFQNMNQMHQNL